MDLPTYRPPCPEVHCSKCNKKADEAESTALHFGLPPTRYGILLIRVQCHCDVQDIACTFKWLESNKDKRINAFAKVTHDYGLRDLVELDGFSLPTGIQQCSYQLEDRQLVVPGRDGLEYESLVDPRFIRAMDREAIKQAEWPNLTPQQAQDGLAARIKELSAAIKRSEQQAVPTAEITQLTATLAWVCMKIFQQFGTPLKRPEKFIDEALPSSVKGTEYDLPLSSKKIQIRPEVPALSGLNSIDYDDIGRKVKSEIKNAGFTQIEITAETTLASLNMEKEDRLEIIFNLEAQQIAHWPLNYDGHDWITVGDIIESAKKHQPVLA